MIPLDAPSSKGEKAFRLIVQQQGAEVAASILRIDGDTGSYSGTFKDGKWVLSHFDGGRPGVITVTPGPDGTLKVEQQLTRPAPQAQPQPATPTPPATPMQRRDARWPLCPGPDRLSPGRRAGQGPARSRTTS